MSKTSDIEFDLSLLPEKLALYAQISSSFEDLISSSENSFVRSRLAAIFLRVKHMPSKTRQFDDLNVSFSSPCSENVNELIASKWLSGKDSDISDINNMLLFNASEVDRQKIDALLQEKLFSLEPDGQPDQLKKATLDELLALSLKETKLILQIHKVITLIEKM